MKLTSREDNIRPSSIGSSFGEEFADKPSFIPSEAPLNVHSHNGPKNVLEPGKLPRTKELEYIRDFLGPGLVAAANSKPAQPMSTQSYRSTRYDREIKTEVTIPPRLRYVPFKFQTDVKDVREELLRKRREKKFKRHEQLYLAKSIGLEKTNLPKEDFSNKSSPHKTIPTIPSEAPSGQTAAFVPNSSLHTTNRSGFRRTSVTKEPRHNTSERPDPSEEQFKRWAKLNSAKSPADEIHREAADGDIRLGVDQASVSLDEEIVPMAHWQAESERMGLREREWYGKISEASELVEKPAFLGEPSEGISKKNHVSFKHRLLGALGRKKQESRSTMQRQRTEPVSLADQTREGRWHNIPMRNGRSDKKDTFHDFDGVHYPQRQRDDSPSKGSSASKGSGGMTYRGKVEKYNQAR